MTMYYLKANATKINFTDFIFSNRRDITARGQQTWKYWYTDSWPWQQ
jgi:hypothetical protein